jgi:hypothetical protein
MPGFADSFWSSDYAAGLGVLFSKLQQGVHENRQVLTIARLRAEAEETYGQRLGDIAPSADKITGGFSRDDGATVRKVRYYASESPLKCPQSAPQSLVGIYYAITSMSGSSFIN